MAARSIVSLNPTDRTAGLLSLANLSGPQPEAVPTLTSALATAIGTLKTDIVTEVARVAGISHLKAQDSVEHVFDSIREALEKGEKVEFRGFGVFRVKERKIGLGRNLKTGESVPIAPGKTVKFKPSIRFFQ